MKSVFSLQWQRFRRTPAMVLSFFAMTILFVAMMAGNNPAERAPVLTYADGSMTEQQAAEWVELLNAKEEFSFQLVKEAEARKAVSSGDATLALYMMEADYRLVLAADDMSRFVLEAFLDRTYREELRLRQMESQTADAGFRERVATVMKEPALRVETSTLEGTDLFQYDNQLQLLFGMSLFFSVYTIMFSLTKIVEEKKYGTWNRLILSPLGKWEIYLGHLTYSFVIGFAQIVLVFLLFRYVFGFNLGDRFAAMLLITACYTFAIVALSMIIMGLVSRPQQLQAIVPILATGMAMIGGAFWPIEIVRNPFLLAVSKILPITYGLDALKGVAIYNRSWQELAEPISIMLLFGVVCMGIGINLMERRSYQ
ncbi:ABC-2 type transport system permease protein [Planomicrobium soli]|uniref:ABC-2 type transport system permease protein n=1 Tax=Planomicrobium soli TaxID=1176648 RepID=A0A2P8H221_9BACL|nr:ABC transporter permease [Planomicrobium soli]PSL40269.1 ABC-2 type transport system permease protein [Planomicrobium soli]